VVQQQQLQNTEPAAPNSTNLTITQGSSRIVLIAGSPAQVSASLAEAEQYKEALQLRGVFVVPLPIFESTSSGAQDVSSGQQQQQQQQPAGGIPPLELADLRWRGEGENFNGYRQWFEDQLAFTSSKVNLETGLYVGLRLDGRVRASGGLWVWVAVDGRPLRE